MALILSIGIIIGLLSYPIIGKYMHSKPQSTKPVSLFKDNGWYDNKEAYCSNCHKLRYMGYTTFRTNFMCTCKNQSQCDTYIDKGRLPDLFEEFKVEGQTWL